MRNDKTKEPLLSDERIFDRVNEYTLPYRTEITRVTKEFRDIYEQARKQDKERIRELEAQLAGRSLPEQGEGPYTIDETIEWLKRRDIFVSAGSRSGFADNLPRVLLDFAAEQAGRLSAQIAHPPQVGATHPSQELIRAGDAMERSIEFSTHQEEGDPCDGCGYDYGKGHSFGCHINGLKDAAAAWRSAKQSSTSQPQQELIRAGDAMREWMDPRCSR